MLQRSTLWQVVTALFALLNLAGAGYAATLGEGLHAAVHVGLLLPSAYLAWRLAGRAGPQTLASELPAEARLAQLQESVDAIALEVERIGEWQRYITKLQDRRDEPRG